MDDSTSPDTQLHFVAKDVTLWWCHVMRLVLVKYADVLKMAEFKKHDISSHTKKVKQQLAVCRSCGARVWWHLSLYPDSAMQVAKFNQPFDVLLCFSLLQFHSPSRAVPTPWLSSHKKT